MTDTWQTIARLAGRLEDHSTLPREQRILLQLLKIQEEAGEVAEAVIGAMGQNPLCVNPTDDAARRNG